MVVSDVSTSVFVARTASPMAPAKAAPKAGAASAAGSAPEDTVALSALASALKGDTLSLFSRLSDDDRSRLGGLVSSGALSADDMAAALSGTLKAKRATVFWEENAKYMQAHPPGEQALRHQEMSAHATAEMEKAAKRYEALDKSNMSPDERIAALQRMSEESGKFGAISDALAREERQMIHDNPTPFAFGGDRFLRTDREMGAAARLAGLGFASSSFDEAVTAMAKSDVASHVAERQAEIDARKR